MANRTSDPNAICYRLGSDFSKVHQVLEDGLAQDYTGASVAQLYIRTTREQTDALAFNKVVLGGTNEDLPRSQIDVFILDTEPGIPGPGDYFWDVRVVKASGEVVYFPERPAPFEIVGGGA